MADRPVPPGITLTTPPDNPPARPDAPPPTAPALSTDTKPLPAGITLTQPTAPPQPTDTIDTSDAGGTLGGWSAAATRGMAPVAAGAGVGAAIGSVVPGVGTALGAGAGALAVSAAELAVPIYNMIAGEMGWSKSATPKEMTDKVLDHIGVRRAETPTQRVIESTSGAVAGTTGVAKGAAELAERVAPSVTKRVFTEMAKKPVAQAVGAATGGAAGQVAREAGAGPLASTLIGMGTSAITPTGVHGFVPGKPSPAAVAAHEAGYVMHPGEITDKPGAVSQALASVSGKIKTQQAATLHNRDVTNNLAATDLGLRPGTPLTDQAFDAVRTRAGQAYRDIEQAVPLISTRQETAANVQARGQRGPISPVSPQVGMPLERQFEADIDAIGRPPNDEMARLWPDSARPRGAIRRMQNELRQMRTTFSPSAGLEYIKEHRDQARMLFRQRASPRKAALARAHMQAADAIEGLMDRQLSNIGRPDLLARYQAARTLIAKSYAIQSSMSGTDVRASRLAALNAMGRSGSRPAYLTGGLKSIADAYNNFPRNLALPRGPVEENSVLDAFAVMAGLVTGHPEALIWPVARPSARHLILSPRYQRAQIRMGRSPPGRMPSPTALGVVGAQGQEPSLYPYYDGDSGYDAITSGQGQQ